MELEPQRSSQASGHQSAAFKERAEQHQYVLCLLVMLASACQEADGQRADSEVRSGPIAEMGNMLPSVPKSDPFMVD
jgi:hypothetical protein